MAQQTSNGSAAAATTHNRILDRAGQLFFQFGFKRVTMDDISHSLGMSKKTLYQHVPGKDALVEQFVIRFASESLEKVQQNFADSPDPVVLTGKLIPLLRDRLSAISPVMMADMQRYYPHLWEEIDRRRMVVLGLWAGLIETGQQQGTIRPEINPKVMVRVIQTVVQEVANPAAILEMEISVPEVIETFVTLMLRGALTEEARTRFEEGRS